MKVECSVVIDQPPSVVFSFIREEENMPLWVSNFERLEYLTKEEDEVGARAIHHFNENGRSVELEEELTVVDAPNLLEGVMKHELFEVQFTYSLSEIQEDKTEIKAVIEYTPKSLLFRMFLAFQKQYFLKRHEKDLKRLKEAIEITEDVFPDDED